MVWDAQGKGDLSYEWTGKAVSFLSLANQRQKGDIFVPCEYVRVKYQKTLSSSRKCWHRNKYEDVKKTKIHRSMQPRDSVSDVVMLREECKNVSILSYPQHHSNFLKYYIKKDITTSEIKEGM